MKKRYSRFDFTNSCRHVSYWIYPEPLLNALSTSCLERDEWIVPDGGLADLSRAQGADQVASWLRQLKPDAAPERTAILTQHYWRLGHELLPEDTLIVRAKKPHDAAEAEDVFFIGEIAGPYFKAVRNGEPSHVLAVRWNITSLPVSKLPLLARYGNASTLTEIQDSDVLLTLKPYIASLRKENSIFFRWLGIVILVFELIYFWPRGDESH